MASGTPAHAYVQYFIPYDGDVEEHPNVFLVRKAPKSVSLSDIQQAFPLPGTYFFRAKQAYGKTHVWLDLNSVEDVVPVFNGKIILKVSRLATTASQSTTPSSSAPRPAAAVSGRPPVAAPSPAHVTARPTVSAPAPAPARKPEASPSGATADMLGLFDAGSAPSASPPTAPASTARPQASGVAADIFSMSGGGGSSPAPMQARPAADPFWGTGGGGPSPGSSTAGVTAGPGAGRGGSMSGGVGTAGARPPIGRAGPIGGGGAPSPAPAPAGKGNILSDDIFNM